MMNDVLGAVNDFILAYCKTTDIPQLDQSQIVRGWQNLVSALPKNTREYVVLTLLSTQRHGTNVHLYKDSDGPTGVEQTIARMAEHMVQVDFCGSYPDQSEEIPRTRADLLEMLSRDEVGTNFFEQYGFSVCYSDDIRPLPFLDPETKQWIARYAVTIHLSGWSEAGFSLDSIDDIETALHGFEAYPRIDNRRRF